MHIYIKNIIQFNIVSDEDFKNNVSEKDVNYIKSVFYSIVFHKILDYVLSILSKHVDKEYILKSLEKEPEFKELEEFFQKNIKDHKDQFLKIAKECEHELVSIINNAKKS